MPGSRGGGGGSGGSSSTSSGSGVSEVAGGTGVLAAAARVAGPAAAAPTAVFAGVLVAGAVGVPEDCCPFVAAGRMPGTRAGSDVPYSTAPTP